MSVVLTWTLRTEGTDEEARVCLERVRERCLDLPLQAVGDVRRIELIYNAATAGCPANEELL